STWPFALSLHDALPIYGLGDVGGGADGGDGLVEALLVEVRQVAPVVVAHPFPPLRKLGQELVGDVVAGHGFPVVGRLHDDLGTEYTGSEHGDVRDVRHD